MDMQSQSLQIYKYKSIIELYLVENALYLLSREEYRGCETDYRVGMLPKNIEK